MKTKLCLLTLAVLAISSVAGFAQNNPPAGEVPAATPAAPPDASAAQAPAPAPDAPAAAATAQPDTAPAAAPATPAPATDAPAAKPEATPAAAPADPAPASNAPAVAAAGQPEAPPAAAPATPAPGTDTAAAKPEATPATPAPAAEAAAAKPAAPAQPGGVIPLIVMDDVPLTDAIKNLARQAGLNYILDPKVAFGQIGPDGKPVVQPSVSIRWENITAEQALSALLSTYNLQTVQDTKSKVVRVTVRDPAAPDPLVTKVIQLKFANPTNIAASVQTTLIDKRSKVVSDVRTSQLVVLATEKELVEVDRLVERLDTMTRQVLIEARLLETAMNPSTIKGIDWSGTLAAQKITFGNNALQGTAPTPPTTALDANGNPVSIPGTPGTIGGILSDPKALLNFSAGSVFNPAMAFLNADGVSAVLSFLNKYAEAKVISAPRTVTLDNEPAKIEVTRASPIITVTPGTVQVAGGSSIQYTNLGVILNVTPRISANNYVNLKVVPEVSRIFDTVKKTVSVGSGQGVYEADEYDIRRIETRVMIPSGNTLVLGGLVQDDVRTQNIKVPVLGDIPILGLLFRSDAKQRQKSNLLVFLTPTIVQDEDFQPATSTFLKTPAPKTDSVEEDWSAWDSGKPKYPTSSPKQSESFSRMSGDSSK